LGLAYLTLAVGGSAMLAPVAVTAIGLGFYALHNTLQTNATQMTPQARGTAVAIFSSAIYLGQTIGVAAGAVVFDRFTAVPLFAATAVALPALAWWFAAKLRRRASTGESFSAKTLLGSYRPSGARTPPQTSRTCW
jgi:predicted MFS family arabinose efflux permease